MRVLFVSANYSNFFTIEPVIQELFRRGHEIHISIGVAKKPNLSDESLQIAKTKMPRLQIYPILRRKFLRRIVRNFREVLNFAHILNHEASRPWDVVTWERFFPSWLWKIINIPFVKSKLRDRGFQKKLRVLEQKIPVDNRIKQEIFKIKPDVIVLLPLINPDSLEIDYMRAAQSLDIPTVYAMVSWDNTTTKGTFHGFPDYCVVWNEALANDLIRLHGVSQDRIIITGAPRFSRLVNGSANAKKVSEHAFYQQTGLDSRKPYVLYVCSTFLLDSKRNLERDESIIIIELAQALKSDPRTRNVNILVRPHPYNSKFFSKLLKEENPNIFVYPKAGELPDTDEKVERFYASLNYAVAVIGVNTTAFLEAAASDKPCITIYSKEYSETQQLPHFHHLVDGNFLETANVQKPLVDILACLLNGEDEHAENRRSFVRRFLAPQGKAAPQYFSDKLEEIVSKK